MHREKRILLSWYTNPEYIAPFVLSDAQITVGPQLRPDQPQLMFAAWTPAGAYDLKAASMRQGIGTDFDLLVVVADATGTNMPLNLNAFRCPKVLCVGDTQHWQGPLQKMIWYAANGDFDFIVSLNNRHHMHWFVHAGLHNVAWIPGLRAQHIVRPFGTPRETRVCFVGRAGTFHPRRVRLLQALKQRAVPLIAASAAWQTAADLFASSIVSFNASLNGDLNLRVFEILEAGGCLLTDRLAPEAGLDLLLDEDKEFIGYDSEEELIEKAHWLLQNPPLALEIAEAGNRAYTSRFLPRMQSEALLAWVFDGKLDDLFRPAGDKRCLESVAFADPFRRAGSHVNFPLEKLGSRLRVYEALQQLHLDKEAPRVLFASDVPYVYLSDSADLKRLNIEIAALAPNDLGDQTPEPVCDLREVRVEWDCVVTPAGRRLPNGLRYAQWLSI
jgi:hypothetical protein